MEMMVWEKPEMNEVVFAANEAVSLCFNYTSFGNNTTTVQNQFLGDAYLYIGENAKEGFTTEIEEALAKGNGTNAYTPNFDNGNWLKFDKNTQFVYLDNLGEGVSNPLGGDTMYNDGLLFAGRDFVYFDMYEYTNNFQQGHYINGFSDGTAFVATHGGNQIFVSLNGEFSRTPGTWS